MNRILTSALLLLATACSASQTINGSRPSDNSNNSQPPTSAANQKPLTGPGGLPLRDFEFETVTTDSKGAVTDRRKGQARYYVEDIKGTPLEMVEIPAGSFLGGSDPSIPKGPGEKDTQQVVSVPSFYIGKYEVTQAQWRAVARLPRISRDLDPDPSRFKGDDLPVEQVSWTAAMEFCARLSHATGRTYRLPSESEWEYACRAGTTTPFAFGESVTPQLVNYKGDEPFGSAPKGVYRQRTTPVGSMGIANGFGLYDMHGNVAEWCLDHGGRRYDPPPADGSAFTDKVDLGSRVFRGGSWFDAAGASCAACSDSAAMYDRHPQIGFRVARSNVKAPYSETALSEQVSQKARRIVGRFLAANKDYHLLSLADVPRPVLDEATRPRQNPKDPPALDLQKPDIVDFAVSEGDADARSSDGYVPDGKEDVIAIVVKGDANDRLYSVVYLDGSKPTGRSSPPIWVVRDSNSFIATAHFIRGTVYTNDRFRSEEKGGEEKYLLPGVNAYSVEGGEFAPIRLFSLPDPASELVRTFKATTGAGFPAYALRIISIVPTKVQGVRWYKVEALRQFPDRHTIKTGLVGFVSGANLDSNGDW